MTTTNFQQNSRRNGRSVSVFVLVSLALHLGAAIWLLPSLIPSAPDEEPPVENEEFEVAVVTEAETTEEIVEKITPPPTPPTPPIPVPPPPTENHLQRKTVEQVTNEERPEEARFLSQEDNKVDEETRAKETSLTAEEDTREPEDEARKEQAKREEVAPQEELTKRREETPESAPSEASREEVPVTEDGLKDPVPKFDPRRAFNPSFSDYEAALGNASRDQRARQRQRAQDGRRRILQDFEARDRAMRASVENFLTEVKPGNHTGVNAHKSVYATYIGRIHRKIHARWAHEYLMFLDTQKPLGDPLNNPRLTTRLEFVINASDGAVEAVNIVKTSGELTFDAEAISVSQAVGPHPEPPPEIVSPNGRVYIHWSFHRDQRQCGPFHTSVFIVNADKG